MAGPGAIASIRSAAALGSTPELVVDAGFSVANPTALHQVLQTVRPVVVHAMESAPTTDDVIRLHLALRRSSPSSVVALGGGSAIDLMMLAAVADAPGLASACERARGGLIALPAGQRSWLTTVAIPTTLGTGAEVSAAACCSTKRGKSLLLGRSLRPAHAAVDPVCSSDLPSGLLIGALAEILSRVLVPYAQIPVGDPAVVGVADAVAGASLSGLGSIAQAVAAAVAPDQTSSDHLRLRLATIGAHTHGGWGQLGRRTFSSPVWFAATELSGLTGWSKTDATRLILPTWARRVADGDLAFGSADRLLDGWQRCRPDTRAVGEVAPGLVDMLDVRRLATELRDRGSARVSPDLAARTADRIVARWTATAPELVNISSYGWQSVIAESLGSLTAAPDWVGAR